MNLPQNSIAAKWSFAARLSQGANTSEISRRFMTHVWECTHLKKSWTRRFNALKKSQSFQNFTNKSEPVGNVKHRTCAVQSRGAQNPWTVSLENMQQSSFIGKHTTGTFLCAQSCHSLHHRCEKWVMSWKMRQVNQTHTISAVICEMILLHCTLVMAANDHRGWRASKIRKNCSCEKNVFLLLCAHFCVHIIPSHLIPWHPALTCCYHRALQHNKNLFRT